MPVENDQKNHNHEKEKNPLTIRAGGTVGGGKLVIAVQKKKTKFVMKRKGFVVGQDRAGSRRPGLPSITTPQRVKYLTAGKDQHDDDDDDGDEITGTFMVTTSRSRNKVHHISTAATTKTMVGKTHETGHPKEDDDDDDNNVDDDTDLMLFQQLPCDTLLALENLMQSDQTCISIPLLGITTMPNPPAGAKKPSDTTTTEIRGVLDCQLYQRFLPPLQQDDQPTSAGDVTVTQELQRLRQQERLLCRLQAPLRSHTPEHPYESVLCFNLFTFDYLRGVQNALASYLPTVVRSSSSVEPQSPLQADQTTAMVEWFVHHVSTTGTGGSAFLMHRELASSWTRYRNTQRANSAAVWRSLSLDETLRTLVVELQVLLASPDQDRYQLWLPTWGSAVLPAWTAGCRRLARAVMSSRSRPPERSVSALQTTARSSPIPGNVLLAGLVASGRFHYISRPSGLFLQAVPS